VDSDDLDEEDFVPAAKRVKASASTSRAVSRDDTPISNSGLRGVGEFMPCGECGERFTVVCPFPFLRPAAWLMMSSIVQTAYTKPHPTKSNAFVCFDCCTILGIDPFAKTKKPAAKRAPAKGKKKEESRKLVSYEQRKGAINLAELCIKVSISL
jgi:DNA repair protein RAD7